MNPACHLLSNPEAEFEIHIHQPWWSRLLPPVFRNFWRTPVSCLITRDCSTTPVEVPFERLKELAAVRTWLEATAIARRPA